MITSLSCHHYMINSEKEPAKFVVITFPAICRYFSTARFFLVKQILISVNHLMQSAQKYKVKYEDPF